MDQSALQVMQVAMPLLLILFISISNCQHHAFFIKPVNTSYCPEEVNASQCYDLHALVSGKHWLSDPLTILFFLPGEHFLELDLDVRNTEEFWMIPYVQYNDSLARISITCTKYGQTIHFQNVLFVMVDSISFHSCGVDNDSSGALQLRSVYHSEIINSKWYESRSSAIFIQDSNTVVSDCQFIRGYCSNCSGGGIHAETSNVTFTGTNIIAENTVWDGDGGELSLVGCTFLIDGNLKVVDNLAKNSMSDGKYLAEVYVYKSSAGGGMYLEDCSLTATNTSLTIVDNNAADNGGGLHFKMVNAFISGTSVVANNSAEGGGGGGRFMNSQCNFTGYAFYYNNSCHYEGGGLFIASGYLVIEDANFVKNSAKSGGAINSQWNSIELGRANFTKNSAEGYGGGIGMFYSFVKFTGYVTVLLLVEEYILRLNQNVDLRKQLYSLGIWQRSPVVLFVYLHNQKPHSYQK